MPTDASIGQADDSFNTFFSETRLVPLRIMSESLCTV